MKNICSISLVVFLIGCASTGSFHTGSRISLPKEVIQVKDISKTGVLTDGIWIKEKVTTNGIHLFCTYYVEGNEILFSMVGDTVILTVGYLGKDDKFEAYEFTNGEITGYTELKERELTTILRKFLSFWNTGILPVTSKKVEVI